jgi:hypothetical protein
MLKRYLIFIGMFVVLLSFFSCFPEIETDGAQLLPPYTRFAMDIVNNSGMNAYYNFKAVSIGYQLIENSSDVFESDELYLSLKDKEIKDGDTVNIDKVMDFSNYLMYYDRYFTDMISFNILNKGDVYFDIKQKELNVDVFDRDVKAINLNLEFEGGEKRVIAGYPESYYSKLDNVVHYGIFYKFDYDKRGDGVSPNYIDPITKEITPIPWYTWYSIKITINSPDDIKVEVLPETGSRLQKYLLE